MHVAIDGNPFEPLPTPDGCWIFLTVARPAAGGQGKLVVLRRADGSVKVERTIPVEGNPTGAALSHDGKTLVIASGANVLFYDVAKLTSGKGNARIADITTGEAVGFIYAIFSPDDKFAFVPAERAFAIAVVSMEKVRAGKTGDAALVGKVPHGNAPVGVALSNDGRTLYSTAQAQAPGWNWADACKAETAPE
ncbi:MAG TPA: hypothetical protein VE967_08330, partial [Gemmatimonadaceae bacterium]|nr:hypothetical protein [Gemmatimonadaceae bacterium]